MFRTEREHHRCIRALLGRVRLSRLWTLDGPTTEACELLEAGGGYLSSGEALYLRVAFDVWNGHGAATFGRLVNVLDTPHLERIFSLVLASRTGGEAVDAWLAKHEATRD